MAKPQDVQKGRQWVRATGQSVHTALVPPPDCPRCRGRRHYDLGCPRQPPSLYWRARSALTKLARRVRQWLGKLVCRGPRRLPRLPREEEFDLMLRQAQELTKAPFPRDKPSVGFPEGQAAAQAAEEAREEAELERIEAEAKERGEWPPR